MHNKWTILNSSSNWYIYTSCACSLADQALPFRYQSFLIIECWCIYSISIAINIFIVLKSCFFIGSCMAFPSDKMLFHLLHPCTLMYIHRNKSPMLIRKRQHIGHKYSAVWWILVNDCMSLTTDTFKFHEMALPDWLLRGAALLIQSISNQWGCTN